LLLRWWGLNSKIIVIEQRNPTGLKDLMVFLVKEVAASPAPMETEVRQISRG